MPDTGPVIPNMKKNLKDGTWDMRDNGLRADRGMSNARGFRADGSLRLTRGGGGGGMAGGYAPALTEYSPPSKSTYDWWKPVTYKGAGSTEILASAANALIPSYADTEATNIAKWLGENFPDFKSYANLPDKVASPSRVSETRRNMFSKARAQTALGNLAAMESAAGVTSSTSGPGYQFLKSVISLLDKYAGTEGGISRKNYDSMMDEFDSLSKSVDASYVELGRAFLNPTVNGAPLMESFRSNGRTSFGMANAQLFV